MSSSRPADSRDVFTIRYYQLYLSMRYLRSRFSAIAALLSITFGVAVVLILRAIMGGYIHELEQLIRGQEADLLVIGPNRYGIDDVTGLEELVRSLPEVEATAPFVDSFGMVRTDDFTPCQLRGIQPSDQARVSPLGDYILQPEELSSVLALLNDSSIEDDRVRRENARAHLASFAEASYRRNRTPLSPEEIEDRFTDESVLEFVREMNPGIADKLGEFVPAGMIVGAQFLVERKAFLGQRLPIVTLDPQTGEPITEHFVVIGAYRTGDFEADTSSVYVHVDALKNLLNLYDEQVQSYIYEGLRVRLADPERLDEGRRVVSNAFIEAGRFSLNVYTWKDVRRNALRAVQLERRLTFLILMFVLVFAALMVLLMLTLIVIEKTRDVGVLLALGATPRGVTRVFLWNGLLLTAVGVALGLGVGATFCEFINPIHDWIFSVTGVKLFDPTIYKLDRIPTRINVADVLLSVAPAIAFGFFASLVPALWAARQDPIKAIHYE